MSYKLIQARSVSYGGTRALSSIKYIVIHYTGVNNDTALNECNYFKNSNTRSAGAHFFVDRTGACYQSIPLNRTAWSVGGFYTKANGAGKYYNICTNANSVSIELCDLLNKSMSSAQVIATKNLVAYIKSQCPNAKTIIRHWDVNGKLCPARMAGTNNAEWKNLLRQLPAGATTTTPASKPTTSSGSFKVKVTITDLNIRAGAGTNTSKRGKIKPGVYTIVETRKGAGSSAGWGRLKSGAGWISLDYAKRV